MIQFWEWIDLKRIVQWQWIGLLGQPWLTPPRVLPNCKGILQLAQVQRLTVCSYWACWSKVLYLIWFRYIRWNVEYRKKNEQRLRCCSRNLQMSLKNHKAYIPDAFIPEMMPVRPGVLQQLIFHRQCKLISNSGPVNVQLSLCLIEKQSSC